MTEFSPWLGPGGGAGGESADRSAAGYGEEHDDFSLFGDRGVAGRDATLFLVDCRSSMFRADWIPKAAANEDEDEDDFGDVPAGGGRNQQQPLQQMQSLDLMMSSADLDTQNEDDIGGLGSLDTSGNRSVSSNNNNNSERDSLLGGGGFRRETTKVIDGVTCVRGKSPFTSAVHCIRNFYSDRAIINDKDLVGLVLYNTEHALNSLAFNHIYTFHDLNVPDVARMRELEILARAGIDGSATQGDFRETVGHGDLAVARKNELEAQRGRGGAGGRPIHRLAFSDTLWAALHIQNGLNSKKITNRKIIIFTDDDDPINADGTEYGKCISRMRDFNDTGITVDVFARGTDMGSSGGGGDGADDGVQQGSDEEDDGDFGSPFNGRRQKHQQQEQQQSLDGGENPDGFSGALVVPGTGTGTAGSAATGTTGSGGGTASTTITAGGTVSTAGTSVVAGGSAIPFGHQKPATALRQHQQQQQQQQAQQKSKSKFSGIDFDRSVSPAHPFDRNVFWNKILRHSAADVGARHGTAAGLRFENQLTQAGGRSRALLELEETGGGDDPMNHLEISDWSLKVDFDGLVSEVRRKVFPQRAVSAMTFRVGKDDNESPHCVVGVFAPVQKCQKPRTTWLESGTNCEVSTKRSKVSSVTGQPISDLSTASAAGPGVMTGGGFTMNDPMSTAANFSLSNNNFGIMTNPNNRGDAVVAPIHGAGNMQTTVAGFAFGAPPPPQQPAQLPHLDNVHQQQQQQPPSAAPWDALLRTRDGNAPDPNSLHYNQQQQLLPPQQQNDDDDDPFAAAAAAAGNNNRQHHQPPLWSGGGGGGASGNSAPAMSNITQNSSSSNNNGGQMSNRNPCGMLHTLDVNGSTVVFSPAEVRRTTEAVTRGQTGITLLCFMRRSWMEAHEVDWHCGRCSFIAPHKTFCDVNGGKFFMTLWKVMMRDNLVAVCEVVRSKLAQPKLAVLYPSDDRNESREDDLQAAGAPVTGSGFYLKPLPYAEDFRDLRLAPIPDAARLPDSGREKKKEKKRAAAVDNQIGFGDDDDGDGFQRPQNQQQQQQPNNLLMDDLEQQRFDLLSDEDQKKRKQWEDDVHRAEKIISVCQVDGNKLRAVPNPALQRIYHQLERLALQETGDDDGIDDVFGDKYHNKGEPADSTLPDVDGLERRGGKQVQKMRNEIVPPGYNPAQFLPKPTSAAAKAGAAGGGGAPGFVVPKLPAGATKPPDDVVKGMDFEAMRAAGTLGKLTVPYLKRYLELKGLAVSGKKEDLVKRINDYLARQAEAGQRRQRDE